MPEGGVGLKKAAVLLLVCVLFLTACVRTPIEDLMTAPAQSGEQIAVKEAFEAFFSDRVSYKYPVSGRNRTPIQFIDLDGDETEEAVVFFIAESEEPFAQIAVMKKNGASGWAYSAQIVGSGTDISSVRIMRMNNRVFLLVEWLAANYRSVSVGYTYENGALSRWFEDSATVMATVFDLNGDGIDEYCYITQSGSEPFVLKYVDFSSETTTTGSVLLSSEMAACLALTGGLTLDDQPALFIDETVDEHLYATQIYVLSEGRLRPIEMNDGYGISEFSRRTVPQLISRKLFGSQATLFPSATPPSSEVISSNLYTYWYSVGNKEMTFVKASYNDYDFGMMLCLPQSWLSQVDIVRDETNSKKISVYDIERNTTVLWIQVLSVGESAELLIQDGYALFMQSGPFRFFVKGDCSMEDLMYIQQNMAAL